MDDLIEEIKVLIIDTLDLEEITPADIDTEAALFVDGLGLDSIDALELGVALQKRFGLKIDANSEDVRKWFYSVASLSDLVKTGRTV
ncbi:MAG: acyl carrier protein [Rhodospirillales bacterium]|jgi:acyl carrier protein|nr:acyl carrier protein [Rhodospirillales bacterium]